jgi:hypothetical protein
MNKLLNNKKQWGDYDEYEDLNNEQNVKENSNLNEQNKQVNENESTNESTKELNQFKPNKYNKKAVFGGK